MTTVTTQDSNDDVIAFENLAVGDFFTLVPQGGVFIRNTDKAINNAMTLVSANITGATLPGYYTSAYANTKVRKLKSVVFTL